MQFDLESIQNKTKAGRLQFWLFSNTVGFEVKLDLYSIDD